MATIEPMIDVTQDLIANESIDSSKPIYILNIERHALHDGPGIRTLIFFMGCPLHCFWCSNPEAQSIRPILIFDAQKCEDCGLCVESCPNEAIIRTERSIITDRLKCSGCGECVPHCSFAARSIAGKRLSVDDILQIILKDDVFYRHSSGGVTASGGEPLIHSEVLNQLFSECQVRGIHTAIETSGYCDWNAFQLVIPVTELFLYDVKHVDSVKHQQYTGAGNEKILENLISLSRTGKSIIVRIPVIPRFNDSVTEIDEIVDFVRSLSTIKEIHLLPYHSLGINKYRKIGREYRLPGLEPPDMKSLQKLCEKFTKPGFVVRLEI